MTFTLIKLQALKALRSISFTRNIIGGFLLAIIVFLFLTSLLTMGIALEAVLKEVVGSSNVMSFLNGHLLFFFLTEMMYRFLLQKSPVLELENYLHLPLKKSRIAHFLLAKSFLSPLSIIALICFAPFSAMHISINYGPAAATQWLGMIVLISWTLHWAILWYKQRFRNNWIATVVFFVASFAAFGASYFNLYNIGTVAAPFFEWSLGSPLPAVISGALILLMYYGTYSYYRRHMYLEELGEKRNIQFLNRSVDFFSRFGIAGEVADLEWKLILRHKKSRTYLIISFLFLLYGLLFYTDPNFTAEEGFSYFYILSGIIITSIFMMQYGQLFLSWNSGSFDFYLSHKDGIEALIKGKYLLFFVISLLCFILSIPYVYFGWDILLAHVASFLFNMGITIHFITYLALWKPKPMSLDKSGFFNYEGIGVEQYLMAIPLIGLPYMVFLPFAYWIGDYFALAILGATGIIGLFFYESLSDICVRRLAKNKYQISSSFRQEL